MKLYPLDKRHKLCHLRDIDNLFKSGEEVSSAIAYPLRALWRPNARRAQDDIPVKILVSIPKKRLRHAVDRVAMRRRIREAYRLNRPAFENSDTVPTDLAFIYVADKLRPYQSIERAMLKLLSAVHNLPTPSKNETSDND